MKTVILANLGTILISLALLCVVALIITSMVKKKKRGGSCGCDCGCGGCHACEDTHHRS